jgi:uncharacterized protein YjiS (DUF1127 family)
MLRRTMRGTSFAPLSAQAGIFEGTYEMTISNNAHLIAEGGRKTAWDINAWLSQAQAKLQRMTAFWVARRQLARELNDLYRLSERELWDMGLSRSDFPAIEKGVYRRD